MFTNFTTSVPKDQSRDSNPEGFRQHFFRVNYEVTLFYTSKLRRDRDSNPKAVISDLPIFKIGSSSSRILSKIDTLGQQSTTLPHWFMTNGGIRTPGPTSFVFMWANHSIFICKNYGRAFHHLMSVSRINTGVLLVLFRVF